MIIDNNFYISSVIVGVFAGSIILFLGRIVGLPITGVLLAVILSSFVTAFLYNPTAKKNNQNITIRGVSASIIFSLIFSLMLTIYYVPKLGSVLGTADISLSLSIGIILLITVIGGIVLGSISGSIASILRDLYTVYMSQKKE